MNFSGRIINCSSQKCITKSHLNDTFYSDSVCHGIKLLATSRGSKFSMVYNEHDYVSG